MDQQQHERLLTTEEAAHFLGLSIHTLNKWRSTGYKGPGSAPPCVRMGTAVRYDPADLRKWLDQQRAVG